MRRGVAAVVVLLLIGGVGYRLTAGTSADSSEATSGTSTTATTATTLAPTQPYALLPGEPAPDVKELTVRVLEALGTYEVGGGTPLAARERLAGIAVDPAVADQAGPLLVPDAVSRLDVIYPQLGGLTDDAASVMTVVRHRTAGRGGEATTTRTIDVRLEQSGGVWTVTGIASTGGDPVPAPTAPSTAAVAALDNPRLDLPDTARWDIEAGRVSDVVLNVLEDLTQDHELSVTVFATGHPETVFGSSSISNHTRGRGVDVWAVDGVAVVSQRAVDGPVYALVQRLLNNGVTEIGAPWDLDGAGTGASFTNTVHQDHLHIAFDGP
jgi:hypothetical protein